MLLMSVSMSDFIIEKSHTVVPEITVVLTNINAQQYNATVLYTKEDKNANIKAPVFDWQELLYSNMRCCVSVYSL